MVPTCFILSHSFNSVSLLCTGKIHCLVFCPKIESLYCVTNTVLNIYSWTTTWEMKEWNIWVNHWKPIPLSLNWIFQVSQRLIELLWTLSNLHWLGWISTHCQRCGSWRIETFEWIIEGQFYSRSIGSYLHARESLNYCFVLLTLCWISLLIDNIKVGDEGVRYVSESLKVNTALTQLYLSCTQENNWNVVLC